LEEDNDASVVIVVLPWSSPMAQYSTLAFLRLVCMVEMAPADDELGPHTYVSSSRFTPVAAPDQKVVSARLMAAAKSVDAPPIGV
jgi:hypothetical protein